jgi:hypothetical protein
MKHFVYFFGHSRTDGNGNRTARLALYELQGAQLVRIANITDSFLNESTMLAKALSKAKALPAAYFADTGTRLKHTNQELADMGVAVFHCPGEWHRGAKTFTATHQIAASGDLVDLKAQGDASCSMSHRAAMHWAVFGRFEGDDEAQVLCQVVADSPLHARNLAREVLADDAGDREIYIDAVVGAHAALTVE